MARSFDFATLVLERRPAGVRTPKDRARKHAVLSEAVRVRGFQIPAVARRRAGRDTLSPAEGRALRRLISFSGPHSPAA